MQTLPVQALHNEVQHDLVGASGGGSSPSSAPPGAVPAEQRRQMVAAEAYRRYERRDKTPGDPVADWLEAEREVDAAIDAQRAQGRASMEAAKTAFLNAFAIVLAEGQTQLEGLAAKAKTANAALRRRYEPQLDVAVAKYELAHGKLVEIREHTDGAWEHLKDGAEKAAHEFRLALQEIAALHK